MKAIGIIFANAETESLYEITRKRTTASIPFGGRYRLIDFALSNMVSAGITSVAVLAQKNYLSLMDHLGSGKDWDLSRRNGGLVIFPPYSSHRSDALNANRLDGLKSLVAYVKKFADDCVVLTDSDSVNAIDMHDVLEQHEANRADITIVYKNTNVTKDLRNNLNIEVAENGRVIDATVKTNTNIVANVCLNVLVINKNTLLGLIEDAISRGLVDLYTDIIYPNISALRVFGYNYDGIYMHISNMENYYNSNMSLLNEDVREKLFGLPHHGIFTKVRDSAPTKYGNDCKVENSFIADGCEIEGTVINSILFRGVKVGAGSVVKDCILMQDTIVRNNVELQCVITDKNVEIDDRNRLSGCEKLPYYLGKGTRV